jgi:alpha-D-ribose 1-methylphosphonate 5-triphosphate synthase subunit PhnH
VSFDAVHDLQAAFRGVLEAFSFPGRAVDLSEPARAIAPLLADPEGVDALGLAAAALIDQETTYHVAGPLESFLLEWTSAGPVAAGEAAFVVLPRFDDEALARLIEDARPGTLMDPHRGATVLVGVDDLDAGTAVTLAGPGIESSVDCRLPAGRWRAARNGKVKEFPLGIDLAWFDKHHRVVALPRTTVLTEGGA